MPLDPAFVIRAKRIIGVGSLIAGLAVLLAGGLFVHHNHFDQFLLNPAVAEGVVVENRAHEVPATGKRDLSYTSYQAIVRFRDGRGEIVNYPDKFGFSRESFRVGQTVRVFYDPQNSEHAMIDRGPKNYIVPGIVCIFGGLMILGGFQRLRSVASRSTSPS